MKLRILDSSIRLRLDRSELRQLLSGDRLVERHTVFGPSVTFTYALHAVSEEMPLRAAVGPSRIDLYVGIRQAVAWAKSDESSIAASQTTGQGDLRLLLEKDFPCEHSGSDNPPEKFTPTTMNIDSRHEITPSKGYPDATERHSLTVVGG